MKFQSSCAHRIDPPRAQAKHHQRPVTNCAKQAENATGYRYNDSFTKKQGANQTRPVTKGTHDADFTDTLFDTKLEEECGQQQSGNYQKEAEVKEVLSEIRRAS